MSKRNYEISKRRGHAMYTCKVTDSYGEEYTNYFETEDECMNNIYFIWSKEKEWFEDDGEALANAIWGCTKLDEELGLTRNNKDNLD